MMLLRAHLTNIYTIASKVVDIDNMNNQQRDKVKKVTYSI